MPVDTSIFSNLLRPPKSITDYGAEMDQAASAQLGLQQGQMNLLSAKQAQQDEQALRKLYQDPSFDPATPQGLQQLYKVGGPKVGMAYQKSAIDIQKAQADVGHVKAQTASSEATAEKSKLETAISKQAQIAQAAGAAKDQFTWEQGLLVAARLGVDITQIPHKFDPKVAQAIAKQAQTGEQQLAEVWKQKNFDQLVHHQTAEEKVAATNAATSQGQLGVARENTGIARENLNLRQQELSKPFEVTGPDGTPQLAQQNKQGQIVPVEGYAPKSATNTKPLAGSAAKQLVEARDNAATIDRLTTSFDEKFASKGVLGMGANMSLGAKSVLGTDEKSVDWWKNYRKQAELVERHALFGAALTPTEQASWQSADISPGMDSKVIKTNLATRQALTKKIFENTQQDLIDAGHNEKRIKAIAGRNTDIEPTKPPAGGLTPAEQSELDALRARFKK